MSVFDRPHLLLYYVESAANAAREAREAEERVTRNWTAAEEARNEARLAQNWTDRVSLDEKAEKAENLWAVSDQAYTEAAQRAELEKHRTERALAGAEQIAASLEARGLRVVLDGSIPPAPELPPRRLPRSPFDTRPLPEPERDPEAPTAVAALIDSAGVAWWENRLQGLVSERLVIPILAEDGPEDATDLDDDIWAYHRPLDLRQELQRQGLHRRELDRLVYLISGRLLIPTHGDVEPDPWLRPDLPLASLETEYLTAGDSEGVARGAENSHAVHRIAASDKSLTVITPAQANDPDGIGKTRLALEYAYYYWWCYSMVIFVRALHESAAMTVIKPIPDDVAPSRFNPREVLNSLRLDTEPEKDIFIEIEKLARFMTDRPGWLLLIDGADHDEARKGIVRLARQLGPYGHILVTSRLFQWDEDAEHIRLPPLTPAAGRQLLADVVPGSDPNSEDATEVLQELRRVPLALRLAGRVMVNRGIGFAEYLGDDATRSARRTKPMETACAESLEVLEALDSGGFDAFMACCYLAPGTPIPVSLFKDLGTFETAASLELATRLEDDMIVVAPVIAEEARSRIPVAERRERIRPVLERVVAYTAADEGAWVMLRPHVTALTATARELAVRRPTTLLMSRLAFSLTLRGLHYEAESLLQGALAMDLAVPEPPHDEGWEGSVLSKVDDANSRLSESRENELGNNDLLLGGVKPRPMHHVLGPSGEFLKGALPLVEKIFDEPSATEEGAVGPVVSEEKHLSLMARQSPAERKPQAARSVRTFSRSLRSYHEQEHATREPSAFDAAVGASESQVFWRAVQDAHDDPEATAERRHLIVTHLAHLGLVLASTDRLPEADAVRRTAIKIGMVDQDHPPVSTLIYEVVLLLLGRVRKGSPTSKKDLVEALLRDALEIEHLTTDDAPEETAADGNHFRTAVHEYVLGLLRMREHRDDEARQHLGDCLARLAVSQWHTHRDQKTEDGLRVMLDHGEPDDELRALAEDFLSTGQRDPALKKISDYLLTLQRWEPELGEEPPKADEDPYLFEVPPAEPYPPFVAG